MAVPSNQRQDRMNPRTATAPCNPPTNGARYRLEAFLIYGRAWLQPAVFIGAYAGFYWAYLQIPDEVLGELYHRGFGVFCADLINWLAPVEKVAALQNRLVSAHANLEIVRGCDGAGALFLMVSAILAFPSTFTRKLTGLCAGVLLMYLLNILRLGGLYFVTALHRDWFPVIHTYLAPTLIIAVGCLYFAWWASGPERKLVEPS